MKYLLINNAHAGAYCSSAVIEILVAAPRWRTTNNCEDSATSVGADEISVLYRD